MRRNGGKIKSDMSGKELVPATQSKLNVTPDPLEVQIDHIKPRSSGESNSYSNAQVLSREENIFKSNKWGKIMFDIDENTMVITTVDIINKKKKVVLVFHDKEDEMWEFLDGEDVGEESAAIISISEMEQIDSSIGELLWIYQDESNNLELLKEKYGVRILNQQFHEMLISFIISQNKQIPHIKQLVKKISEKYGNYLGTINNEKYYSFPSPKVLGTITEERFREMKTGFRAPYLADAVEKLSSGYLCEKTFKNLNEEQARKKLIEIKGVGEKVANCVMLFSLGYRDAFPIDVWIKRIMESVYFNGEDTSKERIAEFAREKYGEYGGYAQQYLFCFGRDNKVGK